MKFYCELSWLEKQRLKKGAGNPYKDITDYSYTLKKIAEEGRKKAKK